MFKLERVVEAFDKLPVEDVEWLKKTIYCMKCGFCRSVWAENTPSARYAYQCPAGEHWKFEPYYASGKMEICRELLLRELDYTDKVMEILYACTTCGNCQENCDRAVKASPMDVIQEMRRRAFAAGKVLPSHKKLIDGLKNYGNPWFQPKTAREKWAKELGKGQIKIKNAHREKVKVLYYVGCTAGVDPNMRKIAIATSRLLAAAGVDFGILGTEESCCGSIYRRIGDETTFRNLSKNSIKRFNQLYDAGVETVVTACAGCYRSIHEEYLEYADNFGEVKPRILHIVEFMNELVKDKKFDMKKEQNIHVTYHDPCHIGRHCGVFEPPREVIKAIPGVKFTEMARNHDFSFCCGAGGGFRTQYFDVALETAIKRIKEAEETGADYVVSTCPFCYQNLSLGVQESNSQLQVRDLTELLAEVV